MPRHLIRDAHEWINEIPAVPVFIKVKSQPRERAFFMGKTAGKEDPVELDSVFCVVFSSFDCRCRLGTVYG